METNSRVQVDLTDLISMRLYAKQLSLMSSVFKSNQMAGIHHSKAHGRGVDYSESRIYQPGDDIRNIDWKVTAKMTNPYTKLFQIEKDKPLYLVLDTNKGMHFATQGVFKSVMAARLSSLLAWTATKSGDKVGVLTYGCGDINFYKASSGKKGVVNSLSAITNAYQQKNNEEIKLDEALGVLKKMIQPGASIMLFSDFMAMGDNLQKQLSFLVKHHDLFAFCITDTFEMKLPEKGVFPIKAGQKTAFVNTSLFKNQINYALFKENYFALLDKHFVKLKIPILPIQTNDSLDLLLQKIQSTNTLYHNWRKEVLE